MPDSESKPETYAYPMGTLGLEQNLDYAIKQCEELAKSTLWAKDQSVTIQGLHKKLSEIVTELLRVKEVYVINKKKETEAKAKEKAK